MNTIDEIIDSLKRGQGKRVSNLVKMAIEEEMSPDTILEEGLLKGMEEVADKFRKEEVGVPEILSITRALDQGVSALRRYTGSRVVKEIGTVVIGTVRGDMHDIGKNLVKMMLESRNIQVVDLGVDVPPRRFVEETIGSRAQIVILSGILSKSADDMRQVIEEFEEKGLRNQIYIMVGGYFMDEDIAKNIGADCYTEDACTCSEKAYTYLVKKARKKRSKNGLS
ncbi:MAG: cobalamin-dependent protein [Eubacteriales bacterium]|nr:cobalamin-dependent protein [Eubacteriales bacterium]